MNTEGTDRSATGAAPFSRAVVTGGLGFLGSHLCARLVDSGVEVVCLDTLITGRTENVERLMPSGRLHVLELDVAERRSIPGPVDLVLHFASPASPLDYAKHPLETMRASSVAYSWTGRSTTRLAADPTSTASTTSWAGTRRSGFRTVCAGQ